MNFSGETSQLGSQRVFPEKVFNGHTDPTRAISELESRIKQKREQLAKLSEGQLLAFERAIEDANNDLAEMLRAKDPNAQERYRSRISEICQ